MVLHLVLFAACLFIASRMVWRWWPLRAEHPGRVEVQRVEELDWQWPAWPEGHDRLGGGRR